MEFRLAVTFRCFSSDRQVTLPKKGPTSDAGKRLSDACSSSFLSSACPGAAASTARGGKLPSLSRTPGASSSASGGVSGGDEKLIRSAFPAMTSDAKKRFRSITEFSFLALRWWHIRVRSTNTFSRRGKKTKREKTDL